MLMCLKFLKRNISLTLIVGAAIIIFALVLDAIFIMDVKDKVGVIFSGIVALATVVYAILTWSLTTETKKMREAQTEPYVYVYADRFFELEPFCNITIKNIGNGVAKNIRFTKVEPDITVASKGDFRLSDVSFIKDGLTLLAPNQSIGVSVGPVVIFDIEGAHELLRKTIEIEIEYESASGKPYTGSFLIDFSQFAYMLLPKDTSKGILDQIHTTSEEFKKEFKELKELCNKERRTLNG